jgi:hypothetical protein
MKRKLNNTVAAVRDQTPVNRPVQAFLLALWAANIAFLIYSLVRHGWQQPW